MKSAEEYFNENWGAKIFGNVTVIEEDGHLISFDKQLIYETMEDYATHRIEQLLDVDLEEVEHTSVKNFTKGAKWLLETLKHKVNDNGNNVGHLQNRY